MQVRSDLAECTHSGKLSPLLIILFYLPLLNCPKLYLGSFANHNIATNKAMTSLSCCMVPRLCHSVTDVAVVKVNTLLSLTSLDYSCIYSYTYPAKIAACVARI